MIRRHVILFLLVPAVAAAACQAEPASTGPGGGVPASTENPVATASPAGQVDPPTGAGSAPAIQPRVADDRGRGFVPLDNPAFISAEVATLHSDDLVLGYAADGQARAYPVAMMRYHHIVNDVVQGDPLLVTY